MHLYCKIIVKTCGKQPLDLEAEYEAQVRMTINILVCV